MSTKDAHFGVAGTQGYVAVSADTPTRQYRTTQGTHLRSAQIRPDNLRWSYRISHQVQSKQMLWSDQIK